MMCFGIFGVLGSTTILRNICEPPGCASDEDWQRAMLYWEHVAWCTSDGDMVKFRTQVIERKRETWNGSFYMLTITILVGGDWNIWIMVI